MSAGDDPLSRLERRLGLPAEASDKGIIRRKICVQQLHRNGATEQRVLSFIDISHSASGEMANDPIPTREYAFFHGREGSVALQ